MKKDFSQSLEDNDAIRHHLLIQDSISEKFLLFLSTENYEDGWHRTLSVDVRVDKQFSLALAKYLYSEQLILLKYRELVSETTVRFSFLDDTPGSETTVKCLLARVDVVEGAKLDAENERVVFVELDEIIARLNEGPFMPTLVPEGIARLQSEAKYGKA